MAEAGSFVGRAWLWRSLQLLPRPETPKFANILSQYLKKEGFENVDKLLLEYEG
jgi:hypothetical protein